jgi:hypothetical protein
MWMRRGFTASISRSNRTRHGRARPGHPRLTYCLAAKDVDARHKVSEATPFFERLWPGMTEN